MTLSLTDIGEAAKQLSSIISTLIIVATGIWFLVRKAREYFNSLGTKMDVLALGQEGINGHLKTLNGSVAKHETEISHLTERVAALEGAVFQRRQPSTGGGGDT